MMYIKKLNIENYKIFKGKFSIEFNKNINILVGDNEAGKTTILEAVNIALSGILNGKYLKNELSQYLFNYEVVQEYIDNLKKGITTSLPYILIEVYFSDNSLPLFAGNGNSERRIACGLQYKIEFDEGYKDEYSEFIKSNELHTIPIEYYKISWKSFARDSITARSIPLKSVLIDSVSTRYQNGSDVYISRIIKNDLEDNEKVALSQTYRALKETFMSTDAIKKINEKIKTKAKISKKTLHISIDLSTQNSWETTLMTYLDKVPFHQIGKGEQCIIKTHLALGHKKSQEANIILMEEPENHLSHTKLNHLIKSIEDSNANKQLIISSHSSFVANKLGLDHLLLLDNQKIVRLNELKSDTHIFFKKLPGYQTLRLLLCRKAILVEGDSDELVIQKAYMLQNNGKLPIEDGIDVISVKLTFKRFLEIAHKLSKPVCVVTDNDGNYETNILKKYKDYLDDDYIKIFADKRDALNTLEPQFVDANQADLKNFCEILEIDFSQYDTVEKVSKYMLNHKTSWALKIFETNRKNIKFPQYIQNAIEWCNG